MLVPRPVESKLCQEIGAFPIQGPDKSSTYSDRTLRPVCRQKKNGLIMPPDQNPAQTQTPEDCIAISVVMLGFSEA